MSGCIDNDQTHLGEFTVPIWKQYDLMVAEIMVGNNWISGWKGRPKDRQMDACHFSSPFLIA